jgi:hypothetical protein
MLGDDSRFRRWGAEVDDLRLEVAAVSENEGPPLKLRTHLAKLHDALNDATRQLQYMQGKCVVCGGAEKVMRAERTPFGFNWTGGELIACPACSVIGVD